MDNTRVLSWENINNETSDNADSEPSNKSENGPVLISKNFEKRPSLKDKEFINLIKFTNNKELAYLQREPLKNSSLLQNINNEIRIFDLQIVQDREQDMGQKSLYLIHYIYNPPSSQVRDYRGIILEYDRYEGFTKILCKSFPYTIEVPCFNTKYIIPDFYFDTSRINIFHAHEGTIIRAWYCNEWILSTHRKIDARRSRWGGPYFGDLFYELLPKEDFDTYLDRRFCYIFLLHHSKNRLVVPCKESCLYHVGTFDPEENKLFSSNLSVFSCDNGPDLVKSGANPPINDGRSLKLKHPKIKYPEEIDLKTFNTWDKLNTYIQDLSWEQVGVMVYFKDNSYSPIKILNEKYIEMRKLRGNEPNLRIRWYQCQKTGEETALENLLDDREDYWDELKEDNEEIINYLCEYYKKRYESGRYKDRIEKEVHWVLEAFHRELNHREFGHKRNGEKDRNQLFKTILERYNPRVRNALIREMKKNRK